MVNVPTGFEPTEVSPIFSSLAGPGVDPLPGQWPQAITLGLTQEGDAPSMTLYPGVKLGFNTSTLNS